jgi:phosphoglycolate phosphatase-like HAD superfamily hydrolase
MAYNAHVTPIVVLSGHLNKQEAEELEVKYIIPDVTHLDKILGKL